MTTLRGAGVTVDARRFARAAGAILALGLVVLTSVLFVAGVLKNTEIARLHRDGVPVEITVSGCLGLLGGSGSNAAGYSCRGTFTLEGRSYNEPIPGNKMYNPGDRLAGVAVPGDPALVLPAAALATERVSSRVYAVPGCLAILLGGLLAGFLIAR